MLVILLLTGARRATLQQNVLTFPGLLRKLQLKHSCHRVPKHTCMGVVYQHTDRPGLFVRQYMLLESYIAPARRCSPVLAAALV
jgi:hypothetical protein